MPTVKPPKLWFATGADVQARRKKLGLNQTAFWERVNITQSGGCRYETGRNIPKPVQLLLQIAYGTEKQAAATVAHIRREHDETEHIGARR
jgi:predicted transcriptional regulator